MTIWVQAKATKAGIHAFIFIYTQRRAVVSIECDSFRNRSFSWSIVFRLSRRLYRRFMIDRLYVDCLYKVYFYVYDALSFSVLKIFFNIHIYYTHTHFGLNRMAMKLLRSQYLRSFLILMN